MPITWGDYAKPAGLGYNLIRFGYEIKSDAPQVALYYQPEQDFDAKITYNIDKGSENEVIAGFLPSGSVYNFATIDISKASYEVTGTIPTYQDVTTGVTYSDIEIPKITISIPTYTFYFDAMGGQGAPASITKLYGVTVTLPTEKPTRKGYTFVCWRDDDNVTFAPGALVTYNYICTFYAVWQAITYTVTYNGNGGLWNGQDTWSDTATFDQNYYIQPNFFVKEGYTFIGWSENPKAVDSWQNWQGQNWEWTRTSDVILFALWMPNPSNIQLLKSGTNIEINKLRYRDNVDIKCENSNSLPIFTAGENDQESGTHYYIKNSDESEVEITKTTFGVDRVAIGKISNISGIKPKSTIIVYVENFVKLSGHNELITYSKVSSKSYYVYNSGILRIQTGNTDDSWKEGQVYVKTNNGWKEASTVYVKTNTDWKESI